MGPDSEIYVSHLVHLAQRKLAAGGIVQVELSFKSGQDQVAEQRTSFTGWFAPAGEVHTARNPPERSDHC